MWYKLVAVSGLAACGVFVWLCVHFTVAWYWCVPGVVALLLLAGCVSRQITIDPSDQTVRERHFLFGRRVLSCRERSFQEFDGIIYKRYDEGDGGRMMAVGLRHRSGKKMWIKEGFSIAPGTR